MKCSSYDYTHPPSFGTILTARHLGFFPRSEKLKYPALNSLLVRKDGVNENMLKNKE